MMKKRGETSAGRYFEAVSELEDEKVEVYNVHTYSAAAEVGNEKTPTVSEKEPSKSPRKGGEHGKEWSRGKQSRARENREKVTAFKKHDPFPGRAKVPMEKLKTYSRGKRLDYSKLKFKFHRDIFKKEEKKRTFAVKQAARSELLLQEEPGFISADEVGVRPSVTQEEIISSVDITSAQKFFELKLQFGPYRCYFTRNGRFLALGGQRGHVAAIDWQTKKLLTEMNVMETVNDVRWLHQETMFAVAQRLWTYIYDNEGVELHCLKSLDNVLKLEFLPFHFLLVACSSKGFLTYLDVSVGKQVKCHRTALGRLDVMCQNPQNAVIHLGHPAGRVTLWSPNVKKPLVKMLCHKSTVRSLAVDETGKYMATSSTDRYLRIWDLRTYRMLQSYRIDAGASSLSFSQRELLAAGVGSVVQIFQDCCRKTVTFPYLQHRLPSTIHGLQFCPFEDVLAVGHGDGYASLLVPGAGEPSFDALEANPYQSKKQRREAEVKMLLDKIQPEMISLDSDKIIQMDYITPQEWKFEQHRKSVLFKPEKSNFVPQNKSKRSNKATKFEQRKKGVREERKREAIKDMIIRRKAEEQTPAVSKEPKWTSVLDRFRSKN